MALAAGRFLRGYHLGERTASAFSCLETEYCISLTDTYLLSVYHLVHDVESVLFHVSYGGEEYPMVAAGFVDVYGRISFVLESRQAVYGHVTYTYDSFSEVEESLPFLDLSFDHLAEIAHQHLPSSSKPPRL